MESRRLIVFMILSVAIILIWQKYFTPQTPANINNPQVTINSNDNATATISQGGSIPNNTVSTQESNKTITVTTNLVQAEISTRGGELTSLNLLNHGEDKDSKQPYRLLLKDKNRVFVAQTGLVTHDSSEFKLPDHNAIFSSDKLNYVIEPHQDTVSVNLKYTNATGITFIKTYTFHRNSYVIDVSYQIINSTDQKLSNISAYWRLLRDTTEPEGETKFARTFTGAVYYTDNNKLNKVKFNDILKDDISYPEVINDGYIGFMQHYFIATWLLNAHGYPKLCANSVNCRFNIKSTNEGNISSSVITDLPAIKPHSTYLVTLPIFVGPEEYRALANAAPNLELTKDYGWVYIFATPLFWLLVKIFDLVNNWGVAIIVLTLIVKTVLYPLTRASYISMAKMRALSPKLEALKKQHGDNREALQKAVMNLYKSEKVNPLGGCLPMLLQIPVFIGLYWALLASVELRQAHFLWVLDLSKPDPIYVLPAVLALTMFLQTFLSPAPADPMQAKMMRIMPLAFSAMFFFFPAGLVLYWLVNNVLSIAQQWYVNNHVTLRHKHRVEIKKLSKPTKASKNK